MSTDKTTRHYTHWTGVYKQGDDLAHALNEDGSNGAEAFVALAERYEGAANRCRRLASALSEIPGIKIDADTHHIGVTGSGDLLDRLAEGEDALLQEDEYE